MQGNVTSFNRWEIMPEMELPVRPLRAGLLRIGMEAYWPQFQGLKERLEGYAQAVSKRLAPAGVEIVNLGRIDSPERAMEAGHQIRRVDAIFLYVATYAPSSTVLPVVRRARVPVLKLVALLNIRNETICQQIYANHLRLRTRTIRRPRRGHRIRTQNPGLRPNLPALLAGR